MTNKIGANESRRGLLRFSESKDVATKIGSVETRDYSIRKPLLKIGQTYNNNFINTYCIS